jgi:hypothetical protein
MNTDKASKMIRKRWANISGNQLRLRIVLILLTALTATTAAADPRRPMPEYPGLTATLISPSL